MGERQTHMENTIQNKFIGEESREGQGKSRLEPAGHSQLLLPPKWMKIVQQTTLGLFNMKQYSDLGLSFLIA